MRFTRGMMIGALLGAGAMYLFDPRLGRRRRARIEDQWRRLSREASVGLEMGCRDLRNRGQGLMHDAEALMHLGPHKKGTISKRWRFKWSPGPRLIAAAGGTALMTNCALHRTPIAAILGSIGFGVFMRAIGCKQQVFVKRTLSFDAPVEQVFEFFANPENYLRISDMVTNVEMLGGGRFAKTMLVGGMPVRFEERFTCCEKNQRIETEATDASPIYYTKQLMFEALDEHRTRLHLQFSYSPPGGDFGHRIAALFGMDAQTLLSDLLMRAKSFLETGRQPHDATWRRSHAHSFHRHDGSERSAKSMRGSGVPGRDLVLTASPNPKETVWAQSGELASANLHGPDRFPPVVD